MFSLNKMFPKGVNLNVVLFQKKEAIALPSAEFQKNFARYKTPKMPFAKAHHVSLILANASKIYFTRMWLIKTLY